MRRERRHQLAAVLVILTQTCAYCAQDADRDTAQYRREIFLKLSPTAGYSHLDLNHLNDALAEQGFPLMENNGCLLGAVARIGNNTTGIYGNLFEFYWLKEQTASHDYRRVILNGWCAFISMGCHIFSAGNLYVGVMAGMGAGWVSTELYVPGEILSNERMELLKRYTLTEKLMHFSLTLDYIKPWLERKNGFSGPTLGLKAGIFVEPVDWQWQEAGSHLRREGCPSFKGPYICLELGYGRITRTERYP